MPVIRHPVPARTRALTVALLALMSLAGASCRAKPTERVVPDRVTEAENAARRAIANARALDVGSLP